MITFLSFAQRYCGSSRFHHAHLWSDTWGRYECPGFNGYGRHH